MKNVGSDSYDAVIIGAGIGGLVCGSYLARAGMKVLIIEQHNKPGGYCSSFKRKGFTFDAAAHSFGGYREEGIVRKVFKDLEMENRITIHRYDPSDIVVTPENKVFFCSDYGQTIDNLQEAFPDERGSIKKYFDFLLNPPQGAFAKMRRWTLNDLFKEFFNNEKLKAILSFPLLGNGGLPPSQMSAFIGTRMFIEFILDGGYYPAGGMQTIPDLLAERLKELGGELIFSDKVRKIKIKDNKVTGVELEKGELITSRYVISNTDARQTFLTLLGRKAISQDFRKRILNMKPSLSMFILYLGLKKPGEVFQYPGVNMWFLSHYNLDDIYSSFERGELKHVVMVRLLPDMKSMLGFVNTAFKNKKYWDTHKAGFMESFISMIEKKDFPELSNHIIYKDAATPFTLNRYTLNYKGAAYGWACTPSQIAISDFRKSSTIHGLYFAGHWTTQGLGIPGVTYSGYDTAKTILRKEKKYI